MKSKHNNGFTLLEVMISVAIIAIVIVSIMRLQGQTIMMNESSRFYSLAPFLAQAKISEVLNDPKNAVSSSGDFGDNALGYTWKTDIEPVNINVTEGAKIELKSINVYIEYNNGEMKYNLQEYFNTGPDE